jgi:hypothetical protein
LVHTFFLSSNMSRKHRDRGGGGQVAQVRSHLPGPKVEIKTETRDMLLEMLRENR